MPRSHSDTEITNSKITYLTKEGKQREATLGDNIPLDSPDETTKIMHVKSSSMSDLRSKPAYAVAKHYTEELNAHTVVSELLAHNFFKCKTAKTSQGTIIFLMDKFPGMDGIDFINAFNDKKYYKSARGLQLLFQATLSTMYYIVLLKKYNIVHNDIKLDNIMIFPIYNPKTEEYELSAGLIDFGHARQLNNTDEITVIKGQRGTPGHQAPEIYDGKASLQSDLFSFGLFLCDILDANCRVVPENIIIDESKPYWNYLSLLNNEVIEELYCFEEIPELQEKSAHQQLVNIINQLLSLAPAQRGDITEHFEACKQIYSDLFEGAIFKPNIIPKKEQTKFDKLMKTATRLAGMIEMGNMFSKNPDDDIAMLSRLFVHQMQSYTQDDKIASLIPDATLCCDRKRHLFKAMAKLTQQKPQHITHRRNITDVIKVLHIIQTSENPRALQEGINNIADEIKSDLLKNILQNWQQESFPSLSSPGLCP